MLDDRNRDKEREERKGAKNVAAIELIAWTEADDRLWPVELFPSILRPRREREGPDLGANKKHRLPQVIPLLHAFLSEDMSLGQ